MTVDFQILQGAYIATVRDCHVLDDAAGVALVQAVQAQAPQGARLLLDLSALRDVRREAVPHLLALYEWSRGAAQRFLPVVGLDHATMTFVSREAGPVIAFASTVERALNPPAESPVAESTPPPRHAPLAPANVPVHPVSEWADGPDRQPMVQKGFMIPFIIVGIIALAGAVAFYVWKSPSMLGAPQITVSLNSIEVERLGREPDVVEVVCTNGKLNLGEANSSLPKGLEFITETEDTEAVQIYSLGGIAGYDAQSSKVTLAAVQGEKRSEPVYLEIKVKPKPLGWQIESLKSLKLQVGRYIDGFSKFVNGAQLVTADRLPPGISLGTTTPMSRDWQLRGVPTEAVTDFEVTFNAKTPTGETETRTVKLNVLPAAPIIAAQMAQPFVPDVGGSSSTNRAGLNTAAAAALAQTVVPQAPPTSTTPPTVAANTPTTPPAPVPGTEVAAATPTPAPPTTTDPAAPAAATTPPEPGALPASDEGMRSFMLARIEKLDNRYTELDRERLRTVVEYLKESRLVMRVTFEKDGQVLISDAEKARLRGLLEEPGLAKLLKHDSCQLLVVGYASRSGSFASSVRASKKRAASVDKFLKELLGFSADLCGDYGPTDVIDQTSEANNRAVEIFAGILDLPPHLRPVADRFKEDFNRRHGVH